MIELISTDDLAAYGVVVDDSEKTVVTRLIRSASYAVRNAAGSPILVATSTVELPVFNGNILRLPGLPIRSVSAVSCDGIPVDGYIRVASGLYRNGGWAVNGPQAITVTYVHGYDEVPEDIVELVVSVVIAGLLAFREQSGGEGFALNNGRFSSIAIDDYKEAYATGDNFEAVTPMTLPPATRRWLAQRFGNASGVVTTV